MFALLTPTEQTQRVRSLLGKGLSEEVVASVTGWSLTDIRRAASQDAQA